ncbi:MAG: ABC transporter ATP-binding protein [Egibacteraceae bacterium]
MIEACGVTVELGGRRVLDGIEFTVGRGEWLTVVGPNGAGKSTLLRYLAGLVHGGGELLVQGRSAVALRRREWARLIALVPQTPVIPASVTVAEYTLLGRTPHIPLFGVEGRRDLAAVHDALGHLDLLDMSQRVVSTLSGGERQRVLLARALAQDTPIMLLDEPTTALDVGHQQQVLELVDQLRAQHALTVVSTMHDLTLAGQYADRLLLLDHGRMVAHGKAADVLTEYNITRYYGARVRIIRDGGESVVVPYRERNP